MAGGRLTEPPETYQKSFFQQLLSDLYKRFQTIENPGHVQATTLNLSNLPTSSAGLRAGDIWVDTGAGNVLKRVP